MGWFSSTKRWRGGGVLRLKSCTLECWYHLGSSDSKKHLAHWHGRLIPVRFGFTRNAQKKKILVIFQEKKRAKGKLRGPQVVAPQVLLSDNRASAHVLQVMKRNRKERREEQMHEPDMLDGQMLWLLMQHLRRTSRRNVRITQTRTTRARASDAKHFPLRRVGLAAFARNRFWTQIGLISVLKTPSKNSSTLTCHFFFFFFFLTDNTHSYV